MVYCKGKMKQGARNIIFILSMLAIDTCIGRTQANQPAQDETVVIATDNAVLTNRMDVTIVVTLTNVSNHPIVEYVIPGGAPEMLHLIVRDEQQRIISEKPPDQSPCNGRPDCKVIRKNWGSMMTIELPPGKSLTRSFNLSDLYDLSNPGTYSVQVVRGRPTGDSIVSAPINVTVLPQ